MEPFADPQTNTVAEDPKQTQPTTLPKTDAPAEGATTKGVQPPPSAPDAKRAHPPSAEDGKRAQPSALHPSLQGKETNVVSAKVTLGNQQTLAQKVLQPKPSTDIKVEIVSHQTAPSTSQTSTASAAMPPKKTTATTPPWVHETLGRHKKPIIHRPSLLPVCVSGPEVDTVSSTWRKEGKAMPNDLVRQLLMVCKRRLECVADNCLRIHGEWDPEQEKRYQANIASGRHGYAEGMCICVFSLMGVCTKYKTHDCGYRHVLQMLPLTWEQKEEAEYQIARQSRFEKEEVVHPVPTVLWDEDKKENAGEAEGECEGEDEGEAEDGGEGEAEEEGEVEGEDEGEGEEEETEKHNTNTKENVEKGQVGDTKTQSVVSTPAPKVDSPVATIAAATPVTPKTWQKLTTRNGPSLSFTALQAEQARSKVG